MMTSRVSRKHLLAAAVVICAISIPPISWAGGSRLHPPVRGETGALRVTEVVALATRQEIVSLGIHYEHLIASGIKDEDLQDGSLVVGRVYCCGGSIEHSSAPWIYVPRGMPVEVGDILEVKMGRKPKKKDPGVVNTAVRVRHKGISNAPCRWDPQQPGQWMRILHCDWMEEEGWVRKKGLYKTWLKKPAKSQKVVKQEDLEDVKRVLGQDADQQAAPATRYRIGIFPYGGNFDTGSQVDRIQQAVRVLHINIEKNRALVLAYSFFDEVLNEPRITNQDRLWVGSAVQKKPNLELVYQLARERELDGVVMCWGKVSPTTWTTGGPNPLWVYLIDVAERKVYRKKGTTKKSDVDKLTRTVVAQFLADRPQATQAKVETPTQQPVTVKHSPARTTTSPATMTPQTASRSTPYRIGVFPCGGQFGSGSQGDRDQQAVRIVQINIEKNRALVLAYSHYDDVLNEPRIKNRDRLWIGGEVEKKPNAEVVYRLARERGLDGVVMCSTRSTGITYADSRAIDLYLIDVERRQVYRKKGTTKKGDVDKLTRTVVAQFLADRPQVVLAKATVSEPATVTPTPPPAKQVKVVTPTVAQAAPVATATFAQDEAKETKYLFKHKKKQMGQASPDKALIYILRPAFLGKAVKTWAFVDDQFIGVTKGKNYTFALVDPGERVFWAKAENVKALKLTVEGGKTYYLQQKISLGGIKARVKLVLVDESATPKMFKKCKYVTPTEQAAVKAKTYIEEFYALAQERAGL